VTVRGKRERGAVLAISLIFLLVMTLTAVTASEYSTLQLRIARNAQAEITTLWAVEGAIEEAEKLIADFVTTGYTTPPQGVFWRHLDGEIFDPLVDPWMGAYITPRGDAEYIIEYLGSQAITGESAALLPETAGAGPRIHLFMISARSKGEEGPRRIVQATYATLEAR